MDHIKNFWENQGKVHKTSHSASWADNFAIDLEIQNISKFIKSNNKVLDVGCANGFSTFCQLDLQPNANFTGVDYAENMIFYANEAKKEKNLADEKIKFSVGSILELPFENNSFDVVYTTRVLINLPTWESQLQGIEECIRVAKKGGTVILSEGFWEPLCLLNSMRLLVGLEPLVEHDFNRYIKKKVLEKWLDKQNIKFHVEEFSSVYYLGSRFLRELISEPTAWGDYSSEVNKIFFEIEKKFSGGGFGVQQAYILQK
jgi:ubiquinone/menaquinone biosynthesis C-methylase UbiE